MDGAARWHFDDQQVVGLAILANALVQPRIRDDGRFREIDCGLHQRVEVSVVRAHALNFAAAEANGDRPAVGVCESHEALGQLPGFDAERLSVEPLVLGQVQKPLAQRGGRCCERLVDGSGGHERTVTLLEYVHVATRSYGGQPRA